MDGAKSIFKPACFAFSLALLVLALGCSWKYVPLNDPSLKPYSSMYAVDRSKYGMSPLPASGKVHVEYRNGEDARERGYDVMLHVYNKAVHHIAFRKEGESYKWVGESEMCHGPRQYDTPDGRLNETLYISYFKGVNYQVNGLSIRYSGPDESLRWDVPMSRAKALLVEWGCAS